MDAETAAKLKKIDEGVWADEQGNVYEERGNDLVQTGAKLLQAATEEKPKEAAMVPRGEAIAIDRRMVDVAFENAKVIGEIARTKLRAGHHYWQPPNSQAYALKDQGAWLLANAFNLRPRHRILERYEDPEEGHIRYVIAVGLVERSTGRVVAEGIGSASTR